jgi:hypothetical protein
MSSYKFGDDYPPTSLRPQNILSRPNPEDVIYVETANSFNNAMAPPQTQAQQASDLAGVLRRNQACLNCRRRKLVSHQAILMLHW